MKILVLNGSPHIDVPTSDMVKAFAEGAQAAAHKNSMPLYKIR